MNRLFNLSQVLLLTIALVSCKTPTPKDLSKENLIPKPTSLTATGSSFDWTAKTKFYLLAEQDGVQTIAEYLADFIAPATGFLTEI